MKKLSIMICIILILSSLTFITTMAVGIEDVPDGTNYYEYPYYAIFRQDNGNWYVLYCAERCYVVGEGDAAYIRVEGAFTRIVYNATTFVWYALANGTVPYDMNVTQYNPVVGILDANYDIGGFIYYIDDPSSSPYNPSPSPSNTIGVEDEMVEILDTLIGTSPIISEVDSRGLITSVTDWRYIIAGVLVAIAVIAVIKTLHIIISQLGGKK